MAVTAGFVGTGLMGAPMVRRLLDSGFPVHVWNRSSEKLIDLVSAGAVASPDVATLVGGCDVLMLCLSDTAAVEQVVLGDAGVASAGAVDKLIVDFSSIDPTETKRFARTLHDRCGMNWVDAPVSGGVAGAESGSLIIMAGGHAEDIESLMPFFNPLAQKVTHMGPVGSGQITKVCNQMIVGCNSLVIAEMLSMARRAGVDIGKLAPALKGGFADSIPLQILAPQMAEHDYSLKWRVGTLLKDLDTANAISDHIGSKIPMSALAASLLREHGTNGYSESDLSTIIRMYETKT